MGSGLQNFGTPGVLDNLCAAGFYLRLAWPVAHGEKLLVITRISQALIALRGSVLRVEPQKGSCGLAVAVTQYKIFSLLEMDK
jgi:hypothetical protein